MTDTVKHAKNGHSTQISKGKQPAKGIEEEEEDLYIPQSQHIDDLDEDEDGRFFGGGLTGEQREIIDILDTHQPQDNNLLDLAGVRKICLTLERAINRNREMRTKFGDRPDKCVGTSSLSLSLSLDNHLFDYLIWSDLCFI